MRFRLECQSYCDHCLLVETEVKSQHPSPPLPSESPLAQLTQWLGRSWGIGSTPQTLSGERGSGSQNSLRLRCSRTCSTHALPKELYDSLRKIKQYWWEWFPTQALYIPSGSSRLSSCNQTLSSFGTHVLARLVNVSNASG